MNSESHYHLPSRLLHDNTEESTYHLPKGLLNNTIRTVFTPVATAPPASAVALGTRLNRSARNFKPKYSTIAKLPKKGRSRKTRKTRKTNKTKRN